MKLPSEIFIAPDKLTYYLLVPQRRGDKSAYLARAGYTLETADRLERDLRELASTQEARPVKTSPHGDYYEIATTLAGPNGRELPVRTIWMNETLSGRTKFITLIPAARSQ